MGTKLLFSASGEFIDDKIKMTTLTVVSSVQFFVRNVFSRFKIN